MATDQTVDGYAIYDYVDDGWWRNGRSQRVFPTTRAATESWERMHRPKKLADSQRYALKPVSIAEVKT